jgi:hypothetical protein
LEDDLTILLSPEVERLARLVAVRSGKTPEDVLKEGVELEARIAGVAVPERAEATRTFDTDRVREIVRDIASAPLLDTRSAKEILDEAWGDPA